MSEELEWEKVTQDVNDEYTDRLMIPQGWLYRTRTFYSDHDDRHERQQVAMVFVPERFRE